MTVGNAKKTSAMKAKIHTERASKDELHAAKHATEARKVAEMLKRPNCAWNSAAISCSSPLRSIPSPATHQKPSAHTCVCAPLAHRCSASCALLFDVEMRASSDQHGRHPSTFSTMSRSASRIALKQAADKSTSMIEQKVIDHHDVLVRREAMQIEFCCLLLMCAAAFAVRAALLLPRLGS